MELEETQKNQHGIYSCTHLQVDISHQGVDDWLDKVKEVYAEENRRYQVGEVWRERQLQWT